MYTFLADVVVFVHLCYMGYVIFGQLAIMIGWPLGWQWIRNPWFRCTHLAAILIVVFEALIEFECPLTTWEYQLRGEEGGMSFTGRLLHDLQFAGATYWPDYIDTSFYVAGAIVVVTAILVPPRFRKKPAPASASPAADATALNATPPAR
jgi:hypothetical protein